MTNIGQDDWIAGWQNANQAYEITIVGAAAEIAMASFLSGDLANSILGNLLGSSPPKATKSPNFS